MFLRNNEISKKKRKFPTSVADIGRFLTSSDRKVLNETGLMRKPLHVGSRVRKLIEAVWLVFEK